MPTPQSVTIVCLPDQTPVDQLAATAATALTPHTSGTVAPVAHFTTHHHWWQSSQLLQPSNRTAAGGPLKLLDLDTMATKGRTASAARFAIWQQVVAQTKPAQPYWTFLDRHHQQPKTYTLDRARQQYLAQPRIAAMRTYNLLPNRIMALPTSHLEAMQAGGDAYTHLGGLLARTGSAMLTLDRSYLTPDSDRLSDLLTYVGRAQPHLSGLSATHQLVALATT
jgi:hypothetical protein